MAAELTIYSIYRLNGQDRYFLLRTKRREFLNSSEVQEAAAEAEEKYKRDLILYKINDAYGRSGLKFIGEMQSYPVGEALYSAVGNTTMDIYYAETQFGHPWIILGDAISEEAFVSEIQSDEDLQRIDLSGRPIKITVTYLTENDFS